MYYKRDMSDNQSRFPFLRLLFLLQVCVCMFPNSMWSLTASSYAFSHFFKYFAFYHSPCGDYFI